MKLFLAATLSFLLSLLIVPQARALEDSTPTNRHEVLDSYLRIQEQLHATQMAIEAMRSQADAAADRNAAAVADSARLFEARIKTIESSLSEQRAFELEALKASNRLTMVVALSLGLLGFCAMILTAFFQWRTLGRLSEIASAPGNWPQLHGARMVPALPSGDAPGLQGATDPSQRLITALEQLDKRIVEIEERSRVGIEIPSGAGEHANGGNGIAGRHADSGQPPQAGTVSAWLVEGDAHLEKQEPARALAAYEEALKVEPQNCEALIRKGSVLEKIGRFDDAIACYDQAIALNGGLTIAFLHKGGLLNRMERFSEALECYEKALHTQKS
jgi:tetratricopeptide (TPR) repeat protein